MGVKKIIYVTPGESELSELTSMAEYQLTKVARNVLAGQNKDLLKVFRTKEKHTSISSLSYLTHHCSKVAEERREDLYRNFASIENFGSVAEVMQSTKRGEVVVVGRTQEELKDILDSLKNDGYNVVDRNKINHAYNVYAVTINPENKKDSDFFVAPWGAE